MADSSSVGSINPEITYTRREFMRGALMGAAIVGASLISKASTPEYNQYSINKLKLFGDRLRFGIESSLAKIPRPVLQQYDLDCDLASVANALNYAGFNADVNWLFKNLPKSDNPNIGVHPKLPEVPIEADTNRWGNITPNEPYAVYPQPFANLLTDSLPGYEVEINNANLTLEEYKNWISERVNNNNPVVFWHQLYPSDIIGDIEGVPAAKYAHTGLVTGLGDKYIEYIDPLNGNLMYKEWDQVYEEGCKMECNLLSITKTVDEIGSILQD